MSVFGSVYSDNYDYLYADKPYVQECDLIDSLFDLAGSHPKSLLDLGCGTGGHSWVWASRGVETVGVDQSEAMLEQARNKAASVHAETRPVFRSGDVRSLRIGRTFDAAVMMFAVLGYQTSNANVISTLRSVRRHLRPDGLFFCDFWFGPGVLSDPPGQRVKVIDKPGGQVIRASTSSTDITAQTTRVDFQLWEINGGSVTHQTRESHTMRYFFPKEIEFYLSEAGLELIKLGDFEAPDQPVRDSTWSAFVLARAVD